MFSPGDFNKDDEKHQYRLWLFVGRPRYTTGQMPQGNPMWGSTQPETRASKQRWRW